jgi:hypothetical protein
VGKTAAVLTPDLVTVLGLAANRYLQSLSVLAAKD